MINRAGLVDAGGGLVVELELHVHGAGVEPSLHRGTPGHVLARDAQVHLALTRQNATIAVMVDWKGGGGDQRSMSKWSKASGKWSKN